MPDKKPFPAHRPANHPLRPTSDPRTQAAGRSFPAVGVTMSAYSSKPLNDGPGELRRGKTSLPRSEGRFKRFFHSTALKRTLLVIFTLVILVGAWVGGKFLYNTHKIFGGSILGILSTTKLKGEDQGRVNILLAGNSADDIGHNGAQLTDSIMLISIDTKTNKAFMMSVPRDLWVNVGNDGYNKINYAFVAGEREHFNEPGYPNGGMGQLESIVEHNFGINIDYYALVDYNAMRQAVDAVGGIDFNVQSSDPRGLYDPNIDYATNKPLVKLTNGWHHLNGEQALDLARARGDSAYSYGFPASDFDRTENQRKMLVALKTKAVSAGVLANPTKLSSLSDAVGNNVKSDMKLSEVHRLYDIMKNINSNDIMSVGLNSANGKNLLTSYQSDDGQSALVPAAGFDDYSDIRSYLRQVMSSDPLVRESPQVVILNGTDTVGLASKLKTKLQAKNVMVLQLGDTSTNAPVTQIIDETNGQKPASIAYLKTLYPKAMVTTTSPYTKIYNADLIIVLGADAVPPATTTKTSGQ